MNQDKFSGNVQKCCNSQLLGRLSSLGFMAYKVLAVLRAKVSPSLPAPHTAANPTGPAWGTLTVDMQVGAVGALLDVAVVQQTLIQTSITQLNWLQHQHATVGCTHVFWSLSHMVWRIHNLDAPGSIYLNPGCCQWFRRGVAALHFSYTMESYLQIRLIRLQHHLLPSYNHYTGKHTVTRIYICYLLADKLTKVW